MIKFIKKEKEMKYDGDLDKIRTYYRLICFYNDDYDEIFYPDKFEGIKDAEFVKNQLLLIEKKYKRIEILKITEELISD